MRDSSASTLRSEDRGSSLSAAPEEAPASAPVRQEVVDTTREKIFATFDDPSYSKSAKFISIFMMVIILVSTLSFLFEAETLDGGFLHRSKEEADVRAVSSPVPSQRARLRRRPRCTAGSGPPSPLAEAARVACAWPPTHPAHPVPRSTRRAAQDVFYWIELVCVVLFTVDYAARILTCPKVRRFVFDPMNLVDLAAILPFWIMFSPPGGDSGGGFGFVRVIRLVRVFRVFKLGRYSVGLQMFGGALKGSVQPLGILIFVMSINMIILSSIVHICELGMPEGERSDHHMRCFGTISRTFWWAMVTMTTVGYGDCYPISGGGKVFSVIAMLSGVLILALPITVIGSNFAKMVQMFEEEAASYSMTDEDGDGMVDEMELREVRAPLPPLPPTVPGATPSTRSHALGQLAADLRPNCPLR